MFCVRIRLDPGIKENAMDPNVIFKARREKTFAPFKATIGRVFFSTKYLDMIHTYIDIMTGKNC